MSMSFKASPDGTYGEILVNGQVVAKLPVTGNAVIPNLVGTVSQSGGVPTGAVVEHGSNANGEYVRFADGTQICTTKTAIASQTPTQLGTTGIYSFPIITLSPFPAVFSDVPNVLLSGRTSAGSLAFGSMGGAGSSVQWHAERRVLVVGGTTTAAELVSVAIGRWF